MCGGVRGKARRKHRWPGSKIYRRAILVLRMFKVWDRKEKRRERFMQTSDGSCTYIIFMINREMSRQWFLGRDSVRLVELRGEARQIFLDKRINDIRLHLYKGTIRPIITRLGLTPNTRPPTFKSKPTDTEITKQEI
jgi:hypothetical protein